MRKQLLLIGKYGHRKEKTAKGLLLISDRGVLTNNGSFENHKDLKPIPAISLIFLQVLVSNILAHKVRPKLVQALTGYVLLQYQQNLC